MNKIEKMIADMCPDGVEWKELGEVCEIKRGRVLSKQYLEENIGEYPVYSSQTLNNGMIGKISTYDFDGEYGTWTTDGAYAGTVFFRSGKFSITNICGLIKPTNEEFLSVKFIVYFLQIEAKKHVKGGSGNPKLMSNVMSKIKIPMPPLAIQEEIVKILDKMTEYVTELTSELTSELTKRTKQYEYYRENLLTFEDHKVEWKTLGEVCEIVRGNGLQKSDFVDQGIPCIHYGQIYTHYGLSANKTISFVSEETANKLKKASYGDVIVATTSENVEDVGKCLVWQGENDVCIGAHSCIIKPTFNSKYLIHYFNTHAYNKQKEKLVIGTKVIELYPKNIEKIILPIPPLEIQEKIVYVLDNFDKVCNDLNIGLPKEIELRQKEYEYYREKLLTFDSVSATHTHTIL